MPKTARFYEEFPDLENISVEKIARWINRGVDPRILENELGNRILYPQTVPLTSDEMTIDQAILREALKLYPWRYFNRNFNKIIIPRQFAERVPDLSKLAWIFIDAFRPVGLTCIYLKSDKAGHAYLGTLIRPKVTASSGAASLLISGKKYDVEVGSLVTVPIQNRRVDIHFESNECTLLDKNKLAIEVIGGPVGVIIDIRKT